MKKVKVLLSVVAVVALVAGALASNARLAHKIYTPNPANTLICDVPVISRVFTPDPNGQQFATTLQGAPCVKGVTLSIQN